jgi:phosphoglycolate/pyridoxal phosphate phosphatase family enzyme
MFEPQATTQNTDSKYFLPDLTAFIFDLDGVIWRGHTPIEGAVESVLALRVAGKRCFYATNNSRLTQPQFADRLRTIGLELDDEEVMTSSAATAFYLQGEFPHGFTCYVIGEEGIQAALSNIGGRVLSEEEAESTSSVDCVVVGIDRFFTYEKLRVAQQFILRGARFFATNSDWTFPTEDGVVPGAGSLVAAVQAASGQQPLIIGKPQPTMLRLCVEKFGLDPQHTAMVGDRLDTDIACGHRAGLKSLMVCTGVHTREQGLAAVDDERPDAIFEDLPELCQTVLATDGQR